MEKKSIFGFQDFCKANEAKLVNGFDYLHAVCSVGSIHSDFLLWMAKFFWPDFIKIDGRIFLAQIFEQEKYEDLIRDGKSKSQAQFWMNLLEVTGIFATLNDHEAEEIATKIAHSWTAKIQQEFDAEQSTARVITDSDTGEIFVVIGDPD